MNPEQTPNGVIVREDFLRTMSQRMSDAAGAVHDMDQMHAHVTDIAKSSFEVDPSSDAFRAGYWLGLSRLWDAIDDEFMLPEMVKQALFSRIAVEIGVGEWPRLSEMRHG